VDGLPDDAMGHTRCTVEQRTEISAGPPAGAGFEAVAACQHQRDHGPGEVLTDHERAGERENRDDVGAQPPLARRSRDPMQGRPEPERRHDRPRGVSGRVLSKGARAGTADYAERGRN